MKRFEVSPRPRGHSWRADSPGSRERQGSRMEKDRSRRSLTLILVNVAMMLDGADGVLLPAVYRDIGQHFSVSPTALGTLTTVRRLVETLCYPASAYLSMHYNRANIIAAGVIIWAASTFAAGCAQTYIQLAITRSVSGLGLSLAFPAILSIVADLTEAGKRGSAYGWTYTSYTIGVTLGGSLAVLLAGTPMPFVEGWRMAFFIVALVSVVEGLLVLLLVVDPRPPTKRVTDVNEPLSSLSLQWSAFGSAAKEVVQTRTFQVIVAQGVPGSSATSAMAFSPMWLELVGFSHHITATLLTVSTLSRAVGTSLGGRLGDLMAKLLPDSGRIIVAQLSTGSAVPLAAILFLGLRQDPSAAFQHGFWLVVMGLSASACVSATNNPIFSEIVDESGRTTIFALDRFFESLFASFATQVVGLLAEKVFGFDASPGSQGGAQDKSNAAAISKALFACFFVGHSLSCMTYSLLYWTYPKDRDRVRIAAGHQKGEDVVDPERLLLVSDDFELETLPKEP